MPSIELLAATAFKSRLTIPTTPPGFRLTIQSIRDWLAGCVISTKADESLFGYTAGTLDAATPEDRDRPRIITDDQHRYIGLALWLPEAQGWSIGGQVGELKTIARSKATVALDMASKPLAGWKLADGTAVGVPDLHANDKFFQGAAPDYSLYTVAFTG